MCGVDGGDAVGLVDVPGPREVVDDLVVGEAVTEQNFGGDDGGGIPVHALSIGSP